MLRLATSLALINEAFAVSSAPAPVSTATCQEIKDAYQGSHCCNSNLAQVTTHVLSSPPPPPMAGTNTCAGAQPSSGFDNFNCTNLAGVVQALEQAGANVTAGYQGHLSTTAVPITQAYWQAGLCPVNVHWHLGTEHYSLGQYDESGTGPGSSHRRLADGAVRQGFQCHHYDAHDTRFTTEYDWKYCVDMHVGQTYEVHWPHSAGGACGTPNQYQTPFYDGVFCNWGTINAPNTHSTIGVQGQVFTIINDESYYYPNLFNGMIVDGAYGHDMAYYTGSTTGTSRNNDICSAYTPITWQVDRTCHLISASSFDKMCQDMLAQRDDMSDDLYPHGSRELVAHHLAANNQQRQ